ncbi:hypothetical protein AX16_005881 [Volvariella volvacea WC 439]|nr:hypothetical protein AX16_005881 [Volvariella volvacea WC 439]
MILPGHSGREPRQAYQVSEVYLHPLTLVETSFIPIMPQIAYTLPDILTNWPWQRQLSPYYEEAKKESEKWLRSFRPFKPREQQEFDSCNLSLLACLTYCNRSRDFVRVGCDLMNFFFVYDEYTDVLDAPAAQ